MDRIDSMVVFARVAETQSFAAASRSLGRSKASVSQTVAHLEERVGARLLQRTTRRVELTRDGALFYERCRDLLSDVEELETLFQQSDRALAGRIRVDMSSRATRFTVIPRLPEFLARHPGIQLELGVTDRPVDLVRDGYDCVVRGGEVGESGLMARRLGEVPVINCASPREPALPGGAWPAPNAGRSRPSLPRALHADAGAEARRGEWKQRPMRGLLMEIWF